METPIEKDKRLQDLLMSKKKDRKPATEGQKSKEKRDLRRAAIKKIIEEDSPKVIKELSKAAVSAEKEGDTKKLKRIMKKLKVAREKASFDIKNSAFKD